MGTGQSWRGSQGFTLIELLIAIAVVGVLAGVAYPAYTAYVQRGKIASALGELSAARVRLEQYYQDNRNYGSTASTCGVNMPSANGFLLSCAWGAGGNSQSFVITATGQAGAGTAGYVYTIDESDRQATTEFAGSTVNAACWLRKKGDVC